MRPNLAETRDPLVPELLPDTADRMELNYRTATNPSAVPPLWYLMPTSLGASALCFAVRLLLQLQHPRFMAALIGAVVLFMLATAAIAWRRGQWTTSAFLLVGAPVFVTTVLTPASPIFAWIAVVYVTALVLQLSLAAIHHAAAWHSADPRVSIPIRRRFLAVWTSVVLEQEMRTDVEGSSVSLVRQREARERNLLRKRLRHVIVVAGGLLGWLLLFGETLNQSLAALVLFLAVNLAIASRSIGEYCQGQNLTWEDAARSFWRATVLWFGYNRHGTPAPGVMLSPAGSCRRRAGHFALTFSLFCIATSLASGYFAQRLKTAGEQACFPRSSAPFAGQLLTPNDWRDLRNASQPILEQLRRPVEGRIVLGFLAGIATQWPTMIMAALGCATVPLLLFCSIALAVGGRVWLHFDATFVTGAPYVREITPWNAYVERLRESRDALETEHVWLGVAIETDSPVIMHRRLAAEHVHLMGSTGSNKTSVGVTQLLEQLIGPDSSLLILDLKGDMALFEAARLAAQNARDRRGAARPIRFRWFTTESERSTYAFNPINQRCLERLPRLERTQILIRALGLEHGEGYGRGHFASQNRNSLLKLLTACPEVDSFRKLHEEGRRQKKLFTTWEREHASDMFSAIHTLANIDAMNLTARDRIEPSVLENAIDMSDLVEHPNIAYFRLPATSQAAANREVGKLAIFSLLTAIRQSGLSNRQIYIVIDEFQQIVSADLAVILQQARSYGVGIIMAHQTQSDLKLPESDLTQAVEENTHFKQIFSVNDLGQRKSLEALSGEALYHLASWEQGFEAFGDDVLEPQAGLLGTQTLDDDLPIKIAPHVGPRLRANDLIEMSARQNVSLVQFKRNVGYAQYDGHSFLIRTDYHVSRDTYEQRLRAPWPGLDGAPGLIVAPLPSETFFYQIGVEKPTAMPQMVLPFTPQPQTVVAPSPVTSPPAPEKCNPPVRDLTKPPASAGVPASAASGRNPIAESLDSL